MHRVTLVQHAARDIKCPVAHGWKYVTDRLLSGERHVKLGYEVEPIEDDPAAHLGGFRMWIDGEERADERICRITEWNEAATRFSLCVEYLDPRENGTIVYATYSVIPTERGCRYSIDYHASINLEIDREASRAQVQQAVEALDLEHAAYLNAGLDEMQTALESADPRVVADA